MCDKGPRRWDINVTLISSIAVEGTEPLMIAGASDTQSFGVYMRDLRRPLPVGNRSSRREAMVVYFDVEARVNRHEVVSLRGSFPESKVRLEEGENSRNFVRGRPSRARSGDISGRVSRYLWLLRALRLPTFFGSPPMKPATFKPPGSRIAHSQS